MSNPNKVPDQATTKVKEKTQPDYLTKSVLDTMEDYIKFEYYCKRPDIAAKDKVCTVSAEVFDLLSHGQDTPFIWNNDVQVFNEKTKDEAQRKLKEQTNLVIIR